MYHAILTITLWSRNLMMRRMMKVVMYMSQMRTLKRWDWFTWPGWPKDFSQCQISWVQCCTLTLNALLDMLVIRTQKWEWVQSNNVLWEFFKPRPFAAPGFNSHSLLHIFVMKSVIRCYVLNVWVPAKFICWTPNAQDDGIRRVGPLGGAEVMRVQPAWTDLVPFWNRPRKAPLPLPLREDTVRRYTWQMGEQVLSRTQRWWCLDLGLAASRTGKNKFPLIPRNLWYFVIKARKD